MPDVACKGFADIPVKKAVVAPRIDSQ
ncbi:MAG: hypothetical protein EOO48_05015 [Flavobacterium sp.]|nr:MAG: hypothetical protein EOO48_05015 [Flavobacterium sp.]